LGEFEPLEVVCVTAFLVFLAVFLTVSPLGTCCGRPAPLGWGALGVGTEGGAGTDGVGTDGVGTDGVGTDGVCTDGPPPDGHDGDEGDAVLGTHGQDCSSEGRDCDRAERFSSSSGG